MSQHSLAHRRRLDSVDRKAPHDQAGRTVMTASGLLMISMPAEDIDSSHIKRPHAAGGSLRRLRRLLLEAVLVCVSGEYSGRPAGMS